MSFEMKGKIKKIFDQQDFPSGFYKRDFVITTEDQYPQDVKVYGDQRAHGTSHEICRRRCGFWSNSISEGREYNGNFYVDLNAWRVDPGQGATPSSGAAPAVSNAPLPEVPPMAAFGRRTRTIYRF